MGTQLNTAFNAGQGREQFPGDLTAALIPEFAQVRSLLNNLNPNMFQQEQQSAVGRMLSGQPSFDLSPQAVASYFDGAVASPLLRTFDRDIAPRIQDQFAQTGGLLGSRRGETVARSLQDLNANLASQQTGFARDAFNLNFQAAESAAGRQSQGIQAAELLRQSPLSFASNLTSALSPFQSFEQQLINDAYSKWLGSRVENDRIVQLLPQFAGFKNELMATDQQSPFDLGGGIQGAMGGMSLGNMLFPGIGGIAGGALGGLAGLFG